MHCYWVWLSKTTNDELSVCVSVCVNERETFSVSLFLSFFFFLSSCLLNSNVY